MSLQYTKSSTIQTVTLGSSYTSGSGTMTLTAGNGAYLPSSGDFWLSYNNGSGTIRIFKVTARSTDTLTVTAVSGEGAGDGNISSGETLRWALSVDALDQLRQDIIQTGAYASATAQKAGNIYLPSDSSYVMRDTGAAFANWGPVSALTRPATSGWSWANQNSGSVDQSQGPLVITANQINGSGGSIYYRSTPATPFTATFVVRWQAYNTNFFNHGVCLYETGTGKVITLGPTNGSILRLGKWSSTTTLSTNADYPGWAPDFPVWFQVGDDGTNITLKYSVDGVYGKWYTALSEAKATFFTTAPDAYGFFFHKNNSSLTSDYAFAYSLKEA
jgi:hypothetical protein